VGLNQNDAIVTALQLVVFLELLFVFFKLGSVDKRHV
jgi:hypothetical protein